MRKEVVYARLNTGKMNAQAHTAAIGFGSGRDDGLEEIDLNEQLIRNKSATFLLTVHSEAMSGAGIFSGDTLIVDRSIKAVNGKIVVAALNGEMLIRRLQQSFNSIQLLPENPAFANIAVDISGVEFAIWGVVTYCIHSY